MSEKEIGYFVNFITQLKIYAPGVKLSSRHEAASRFVHGRKYELMELCAVMGWRDPKMAQDYYAPTASELASRLR